MNLANDTFSLLDMGHFGISPRNQSSRQEARNRLANELAAKMNATRAGQPQPGGPTETTAVVAAACAEPEPNTALLTAIIVFCTFILAFMLRKLRESFYLGKHVCN